MVAAVTIAGSTMESYNMKFVPTNDRVYNKYKAKPQELKPINGAFIDESTKPLTTGWKICLGLLVLLCLGSTTAAIAMGVLYNNALKSPSPHPPSPPVHIQLPQESPAPQHRQLFEETERLFD